MEPKYVIYLPDYPHDGEMPGITLLGPYDGKGEATTALKELVWKGELVELWPPDSE